MPVTLPGLTGLVPYQVQTALHEIAAGLNALEQQVRRLETLDTRQVQAQIQGVQSSLQTLTGRLDSVERRVTALENP